MELLSPFILLTVLELGEEAVCMEGAWYGGIAC